MDSPLLTALIFSKNSTNTIIAAAKSVSFADEIIVIDMMSQDDSVEKVREYVTKVVSHPDLGYVEPVRNFALSQAKGRWILILDADESVPVELRKALQDIIHMDQSGSPVSDCYYLPRKNIIFSKWVKSAGWWPDKVLRFFRKGHVEWSEAIHSVPFTRGTVAELPASEANAIHHENYQSISQFVDRLNRYTSIQANEKSETSAASESELGDSALNLFRKELMSRLFDRSGINGGMHGISLSLLQSFSEVIVALKLWEKQGFPGQQRVEQSALADLNLLKRDLAYWIADYHVNKKTGLAQLIWRVRRKLCV